MKKERTKHVNGVLTKIMGTNKKHSEFERFLKEGPAKTSPGLAKMTTTYKNIVTHWKTQFDKVSLLEETILQLRAQENISEIKLSTVKGEYIYARSPFYRRAGSTKDIRVVVGKMNPEKENLNSLQKNSHFMRAAKKQISIAMDKIILANINKLYKLNKT